MPKEYDFFELPIYRVTKEKYYKDMDEYIQNKFAKLNDFHREYYKNNLSKLADWKHACREEYGSIWEYNDVIGYIKLYFSGSQVRADHWSVKAKRIVKSKKKEFICIEESIYGATTIHFEKESLGIYNKIIELVDEIKSTLRNRYIETSKFEAIGPYVDWKKLYEKYRSV